MARAAALGLALAPFLLAAGALAVPGAAQQADEDFLPAGPGKEQVVAYCQACHSLKIVQQQGLDRESWDETLTWMVEEQEMPALEPDERALILDYLSTHRSPTSPRWRPAEGD